MSWASKAHKKYQVEKLVKEVLRNPEYKKMQQQEDLKCFSCLALISVDFMMRNTLSFSTWRSRGIPE